MKCGAIAIFVVFGWAGVAWGEDLFPDGTFQKAEGTKLPAEIAFGFDAPDGGTVTASITDDAPAPGERALLIERTAPKGNARARYRPIPVREGGRYYFSCRTKTDSMGTGVYLEFLDAGKKSLPGGGAMEDAVSTNPNVEFRYGTGIELRRFLADDPDGFNTLDVTFTVPPGAAFVAVSLSYGWTRGRAVFGELKLLPLDGAP